MNQSPPALHKWDTWHPQANVTVAPRLILLIKADRVKCRLIHTDDMRKSSIHWYTIEAMQAWIAKWKCASR